MIHFGQHYFLLGDLCFVFGVLEHAFWNTIFPFFGGAPIVFKMGVELLCIENFFVFLSKFQLAWLFKGSNIIVVANKQNWSKLVRYQLCKTLVVCLCYWFLNFCNFLVTINLVIYCYQFFTMTICHNTCKKVFSLLIFFIPLFKPDRLPSGLNHSVFIKSNFGMIRNFTCPKIVFKSWV